MDKREYIESCKKRALSEKTKLQKLASMMSDLKKNPETENHENLKLIEIIVLGNQWKVSSDEEIEDLIMAF